MKTKICILALFVSTALGGENSLKSQVAPPDSAQLRYSIEKLRELEKEKDQRTRAVIDSANDNIKEIVNLSRRAAQVDKITNRTGKQIKSNNMLFDSIAQTLVTATKKGEPEPDRKGIFKRLKHILK